MCDSTKRAGYVLCLRGSDRSGNSVVIPMTDNDSYVYKILLLNHRLWMLHHSAFLLIDIVMLFLWSCTQSLLPWTIILLSLFLFICRNGKGNTICLELVRTI